MSATLLSGQNTEPIRRRIAKAARRALPCRVCLVYDHDQWWAISDPRNADSDKRTWAVEDADGPGSFDGFSFEGV